MCKGNFLAPLICCGDFSWFHFDEVISLSFLMRCISTFWPTLTFGNFEFQVFSNKGVKVFTNKIVFLLMLLFVVVSYQFKSFFFLFLSEKVFHNDSLQQHQAEMILCAKLFLLLFWCYLKVCLFDCFVICRYMLCYLLYETLVSFLIHMCLLLIPWQWYFELWKECKTG